MAHLQKIFGLFLLLGLTITRAVAAPAPDVEAIAEKNRGAVVTIYGERGGKGQAVQGTGCCVHPSGLVLTVAHAVEGADRLRIRLSDGSEREAQLLEADASRDVALLKGVDGMASASLGDAASLRAGSPLVTISAPKGLFASVASGIVSSTERQYDGRPVLQSDLALNEGSSGGPVFDRDGRLVGLVRARLDEVDAATLVLPVNEAFALLRKHGVGVPGAGGETAAFASVEPQPEASDAEREAIENYNRAVAAGSFQQKLIFYNRATTLRPDFFEAWFNLGVTYAAEGRFADAEGAYKQARALRPESVESLRNLGRVLLQQEKLADVEECFRRAVELAPQDPGAHNDLGEVYRRQNRLEEARQCFQKALQIQPNYAPARYNLGLTFAGMGRWTEAAFSFRSYLRLAPDAPDAEEVKGWLEEIERKK